MGESDGLCTGALSAVRDKPAKTGWLERRPDRHGAICSIPSSRGHPGPGAELLAAGGVFEVEPWNRSHDECCDTKGWGGWASGSRWLRGQSPARPFGVQAIGSRSRNDGFGSRF